MSLALPKRPRAALALGALLLGLGAGGAAADRIGVAGAVNPATQSDPPGVPTRTLVIGNDVVFNEKITTTTGGQAQILFLDRSAISIGPNSEVVIDEFVYDPNAGTGKLVASLAKGAARFVGGALSKNEGAVSFRTPTATIGIRGGMFSAFVEAATGATTVIKHFGVVTLRTGEQVVTLNRSDRPTSVPAPGVVTPGSSGPAGQALVQQIAQLFNPAPGTSGGAPFQQRPTDGSVQQGFSPANSGNFGAAREDASARSPTPASPPPPPNQGGREEPARQDKQTADKDQGVRVDVIAINPNFLNPPPVPTIEPPVETIDPAVDAFAAVAQFFGEFLANNPTAVQAVFPTLPLIDLATMPRSGSATYNGSSLAAVDINGNRSIFSGSYAQSWNFGSQTGSVFISISGANGAIGMSAPVAAGFVPNVGPNGAVNGTDPRFFAGTLSGSGPTGAVSGALGGAFFGTSFPDEAHAGFNITGPNLVGTGAGKGSTAR